MFEGVLIVEVAPGGSLLRLWTTRVQCCQRAHSQAQRGSERMAADWIEVKSQQRRKLCCCDFTILVLARKIT